MDKSLERTAWCELGEGKARVFVVYTPAELGYGDAQGIGNVFFGNTNIRPTLTQDAEGVLVAQCEEHWATMVQEAELEAACV